MLGFDEVIKLVSTDGKVIGTMLGYVDVITLFIDAGTELGSLDGSFYVNNYGNLEGGGLDTHWYLLMLKFLDLMKLSN